MNKEMLQRVIQDIAIWVAAQAVAQFGMLQLADLTHAHGRFVAAGSGAAILLAGLKNFPDLSNPPEPQAVALVAPVQAVEPAPAG